METQQLIGELGALSYGGILIVAFLSNVVIPVPEEIVLLIFGYLAGTGAVNLFIVLPLIIAGLLLSDIVVYTLSKKGSHFIIRIYERFFSKKITPDKNSWIRVHITKVIFISRFLVQLRFIGPFFAGQLGVPLKKYVTYDFLALIVYVPLYVFLGKYFHRRVQLIVEDVHIVKDIVLIIAGVFVVYMIIGTTKRLLFKEGKKCIETTVPKQ